MKRSKEAKKLHTKKDATYIFDSDLVWRIQLMNIKGY
jgi:hypothetical protein